MSRINALVLAVLGSLYLPGKPWRSGPRPLDRPGPAIRRAHPTTLCPDPASWI
jgi:hypothetical protein